MRRNANIDMITHLLLKMVSFSSEIRTRGHEISILDGLTKSWEDS